MKEGKKILQTITVLSLLVAVLGITVGFASMSRTLTINGTTAVEPANWSVHFTNLKPVALTNSATETVTPTLSEVDTHMGDYAVSLTKPGDKAVYYVDVVNDGDINAALTSVTIAQPTITATSTTNKDADEAAVKNSLLYSVTYADGSAIASGDELVAKTGKATLKISIEYDLNSTVIPSDDVTISGMDVTLIYGQKN